MTPFANRLLALVPVAFALGASGAHAEDYRYTYVGNPTTLIAASGDNRFGGGRVTVSFRSQGLLAANQTFSLRTTPTISEVIVNFDSVPLGSSPEVDYTFSGHPDAWLETYYSYVTIGSDTDTIAQWEIAKFFNAPSSPDSSFVGTVGYQAGYPGLRPFCTYSCAAFDRVALADNGAWVYDTPGTWTITVVPEPSAMALMLAGLAGVGAAARRRRSCKSR